MGACKNDNNKENYIIATFNIYTENIYGNVRIINSFEHFKGKKSDIQLNDLKKYESNQEKIKDCEIYINNQRIPFNFFHKFNKKGEYTIKYKFNQILTNISFMFAECELLTEINLSHFISKYVRNTSYMFFGCSSLSYLNFTKFDCTNIIYMNNMFDFCSSIINLDLSNLNTKNVVDMSFMFRGCIGLTNLDLTNFNTKNVIKMNSMFDYK